MFALGRWNNRDARRLSEAAKRGEKAWKEVNDQGKSRRDAKVSRLVMHFAVLSRVFKRGERSQDRSPNYSVGIKVKLILQFNQNFVSL